MSEQLTLEGVVEGVNFVQTACASFRCYGTRNKGVRIFDIDEATGNYETKFYNFHDLCGGGLYNELCYIWDADDMVKQKAGLIAGCVAGAIGLSAAIVKLLKK